MRRQALVRRQQRFALRLEDLRVEASHNPVATGRWAPWSSSASMQIHNAVLPRKFDVSTHEFLNVHWHATATEGMFDATSGGGHR